MSNFDQPTIDQAIQKAKQRDSFLCQICFGLWRGWVEGAHLFVRHCSLPKYRNNDPYFIVTLCPHCHAAMDKIKNHKARAAWLLEKGLELQSKIILWVIGEIAERP